jgi:hypothetical protein
MMVITPISSIGTRDKRDSINNKCNNNKTENVTFDDFLKDLMMEQKEQM